MSDIDRLVRFAAVAEELSFSKAARRLNVDQPWLSRQIQQLEMRLGFALFVRSTRSVALTPEGQNLYSHAASLKHASDECRDATRDMMRSHNFVLPLGVNPYSFWLPERHAIIDAFQARHERVSIELASNYTSRLISKLRKRLIEVAIIAQPFEFPDLESMVIHSRPVSLLVPPEDELAQHASVPLSALAGREIPITNPRLNPALFDIVYGPFFAAGAKQLIVPEGDPAVAYTARSRRLPFVCMSYPFSDAGQLSDFVHVKLEPPVPLARFALVRRNEPARAVLDHFWNTALAVTGQESADAAKVKRLIPRAGRAKPIAADDDDEEAPPARRAAK